MASNYTEHYQLPIWDPEDSFLREEFNETHQKIDNALTAIPYVRIAALKTDSSASVVRMDVQTIDFTRYLRVDLFFLCPGGGCGDVELCLNGLTAEHCVHGSGSGGASSGLTFYRSLGTLLGGSGQVSFFTPWAGEMVGCTFASCSAYKTEYQQGASWANHVSRSVQVTWDALTSFDLRCTSSGSVIPAGSELILCGVRK